MLQDKEKWDRKYREKKYPTTPSQIVRNHFDLATGKKALNIAFGYWVGPIIFLTQGHDLQLYMF